MADAGDSPIIRKASPQTKQGANYGYPSNPNNGVPNKAPSTRTNTVKPSGR